MDSKYIEIASCKTCKNVLLVVENMILIRYYEQTAKTRALDEFIDGAAGRPGDKLPKSGGLGVYQKTVPKLAVRVGRLPRPQFLNSFVWAWIWTRSDGPESFRTLLVPLRLRMHRLLAWATLGCHSRSPPSTISRSIKWTSARLSWELTRKKRFICTCRRDTFVCSKLGADTTFQGQRLCGRWYAA